MNCGPRMRMVPADGAVLAVTSEGAGAPVLVVQTALTLDENLPLMRRLGQYDRFRVIGFHRRGYGDSTPAPGPGAIAVDAADCLAVLAALDALPAHLEVQSVILEGAGHDVALTHAEQVAQVTAEFVGRERGGGSGR